MNIGPADPTQPANLVCPACGYHQRGLPLGSRCPECGLDCNPAVIFGAVNRWADGALLDLWSISVFQSLGAVSGLVAVVGLRRGEPVAVPLMIMAGLYLAVAGVWFGFVFVGFIRRTIRPELRNVHADRRRRIRRWIIGDALLIAVPPILLWLF